MSDPVVWVTGAMRGPTKLWHRGRPRRVDEDFVPYLFGAPGRRGGEIPGVTAEYADTLCGTHIGSFAGLITFGGDVPPNEVIAEGKPSHRTLCLRCVMNDGGIE